MSVLRIYDPPECTTDGDPLDWECCRKCEGTGRWRDPHYWGTMPGSTSCETCEGHGSLKAAALAHFRKTACAACGSAELRTVCAEADRIVFGCRPGGRELPLRCESCSHPMSEGTWEYQDQVVDPATVEACRISEEMWLVAKRDEGVDRAYEPVHYSPCDEGCTHLGPRRATYRTGQAPSMFSASTVPTAEMIVNAGPSAQIEAPWRQVDIRRMGWPHDLRPEKLATLCLRCYAWRHGGQSQNAVPAVRQG